jgi:drug/metabolite transporter (DMT)-like permease
MRVGGNFVLLLAGCWLLLLIAVSTAAASGDSDIPPINWVPAIVPGFALVPAAYYAVKSKRSSNPEEVKALWHKCALYGGIGLALGIVTIVQLNAMQNGAGQ